MCRTKNSEGVKKEIAIGRKTTQIFVNNLYIQKHIKFVSISKKLDSFVFVGLTLTTKNP